MKQNRKTDNVNITRESSKSITPIRELERSPGSSPKRQQSGTANDISFLLTAPAERMSIFNLDLKLGY